jgi:hypothetical protein
MIQTSRAANRCIDLVPLLSRGKHRRPRQGACFMEFASYLAGERWSDHPACTHPLLASLARQVNDHISDDARQTLLPLIPDVIGLTSDDPRVDAVVALRAAATALPAVAEERQRVLALALLRCERLLAELDGRTEGCLTPHGRAALEAAPGAAAWARRHCRDFRTSRRVFRRQTAPAIVSCAVVGIAQACCGDADRLLRQTLVESIGDCRPFRPQPAPERRPVYETR